MNTNITPQKRDQFSNIFHDGAAIVFDIMSMTNLNGVVCTER